MTTLLVSLLFTAQLTQAQPAAPGPVTQNPMYLLVSGAATYPTFNDTIPLGGGAATAGYTLLGQRGKISLEGVIGFWMLMQRWEGDYSTFGLGIHLWQFLVGARYRFGTRGWMPFVAGHIGLASSSREVGEAYGGIEPGDYASTGLGISVKVGMEKHFGTHILEFFVAYNYASSVPNFEKDGDFESAGFFTLGLSYGFGFTGK